MTVRTGICKCGKSKEKHLTDEQLQKFESAEHAEEYCRVVGKEIHFYKDSGLHRLHENAESLFEAVSSLTGGVTEEVFNSLPPLVQDDLEKLESIISKITAL